MLEIADLVAESLLMTVLFTGICIFYSKELSIYTAKLKTGRRLRERRKQLKPKSKLQEHMDCVAGITLNISGSTLTTATILLFAAVIAVAGRSLSPSEALFIAASVAILPYTILRIKFEGIKRKGSFEGELIISNFLNQYRIANFNVYEALEKLIAENKTAKVSNSLVLKMLLELRSTGNPQEIRKAVDKFAAVINTNWSRMFAYNIQLAAEKGINVSLAIEDILLQLRDARVLYEERKRLNSESTRIVVYMIPLLYVLTVIMSVKYIGITLFHYIENQLFTKEGFMFMTVSGVMFLLNIAMMEAVSRQKFDY